ncbi:MAG: 3-isopropylmalate dehydratase large subunit [Candidatus Heimdallarchaeota archaeon]|nr:3-isopropylmalate dehydratase large subunit [Candidatus Heimdallarchaeota archaeon]MCK5048791.1 3-isopropylmalate dehydratase large subunit [Candidatus Heimdallarchaeota archaeon]
MAQTLIQKIIAKNAGKESVEEGEIVFVSPHRILTHDNSAAISGIFKKMFPEGVTPKVWDSEKLFIALDHQVPPPNEKAALNHKNIREFVEQQEIKYFYEGGTGICHQVLPEKGHVLPGVVIFGSDSHTTAHGALGAASIPIGRTEAASVWAIGETWLKVPETIKITVNGTFSPNVYPKDLILHILGDISAEGALYKAVEFHGEAIENMSISGRFTLCNMGAEMGAKATMVPPDQKTREWLTNVTTEEYTEIHPDEDAKYELELVYNASEIVPTVACPHNVDIACAVKDLSDKKINVALLGTCTNGRLDDIKVAAEVLEGKKVHPDVRLLIYPASREVLSQALEKGYIQTLIDAGGQLSIPACGPCLGAYGGILAPGERAISTANRNFLGRMGCKTDTEIYLASPATVAASAVKGFIASSETIKN